MLTCIRFNHYEIIDVSKINRYFVVANKITGEINHRWHEIILIKQLHCMCGKVLQKDVKT